VAESEEVGGGFDEIIEGFGLKVTFRLGFLCESVDETCWMRGEVSLDRLADDILRERFRRRSVRETRAVPGETSNFSAPQAATLKMVNCTLAVRI